MSKSTMRPDKKEALVEWIGDFPNGATTQEIADAFEVHYQTAYGWVKQLEEERLVRKGDFKQPYRYVTEARTQSGPILVRHGKYRVTPAAWAMTSLQEAGLAKLAHAFVYLFVRSYYYDAPDQQHLRGVLTPQEVRDLIEEVVKDVESQLAIAKQLLSIRTPWSEGPLFAQRFGSPPVGLTMQDAVDAARLFSRAIAKNSLTSDEEHASMEGQGSNEQGV